MRRAFIEPTIAWLLLVIFTAAAWILGHSAEEVDAKLTASITISILVSAFFKVALVMLYFMEVRFAPRALLAMALGWCIAMCAILIGLHFA